MADGMDKSNEHQAGLRDMEGRSSEAESLGDVRLSIEAYGVEEYSPAKGRQVSQILDSLPESHHIRVEFWNVNAQVPLMDFGSGGTVKKLAKTLSRQYSLAKGLEAPASKKQILFGLAGSTNPGEVLAMMGPSGSGKTSLLSILGARAPKNMTVEGHITFNGQSLSKSTKRRIGYVTQDDLMYETLTVYETLYFAALLRLPREMSRMEKRERVEAVIAALGLEKCRDTIIGGPMMRGVSGGERKRVAVGHELLTNPAVLMLDEPTSGLDATAAMHLVTTLRQLAEGGRTIITTIHQPSSRLYQQLNTLMLLSEGQRMYYGDAKLVMEWFKVLGRPVPLGVNIADFILDLANGDILDADKTGEQCREELVASFVGYVGQSMEGITCEEDISRYQNGLPFKGPGMVEKNAREASPGNPLSSPVASSEKWGAGFFEQLTVLWQRTLRTRRFESFSSQRFAQLLGVALISGLLWFQAGKRNTLLAANDISALLFFVMMFQLFNSMFAALFTFPSEFQLMKKERSSGMYRLSAFYISRTASELPMDCLIPTICIFTTYWLTGLKPTFAAFVGHWFGLLLSVMVAQTVGLLIGGAVMDFKRASTICTLLLLTMMLTGGFFIRDLPLWLSWLKYCSFVFYSNNLLMKIEFHGREFVDCGEFNLGTGTNMSSTECTPVKDLKDALGLAVDVNDSVTVDVIALFGSLLALRIGLYYVLKHKTKN